MLNSKTKSACRRSDQDERLIAELRRDLEGTAKGYTEALERAVKAEKELEQVRAKGQGVKRLAGSIPIDAWHPAQVNYPGGESCGHKVQPGDWIVINRDHTRGLCWNCFLAEVKSRG